MSPPDRYSPGLESLDVDRDWQHFATGLHGWILQTQPGLVPRDASRGTSVTEAAFKHHKSLDAALRGDRWVDHLAGFGVAWQCDDAGFAGAGDAYDQVAWNDYRRTDLIVAVRPGWTDAALTKPPSKLVNAWTAGVPAVLGPEYAYRELRRRCRRRRPSGVRPAGRCSPCSTGVGDGSGLGALHQLGELGQHARGVAGG